MYTPRGISGPGSKRKFVGYTLAAGCQPTVNFRYRHKELDGVTEKSHSGFGERWRDLVGGDADDVVLANSASYGLHLIANGLHWRTGDEVLVMDSEFPSDILPWLRLESRGVSVRRERPTACVFEVDEIRSLIGPKTRLLCLTWVHSFSEWASILRRSARLRAASGTFAYSSLKTTSGSTPIARRVGT